jgi:hypothetical protein
LGELESRVSGVILHVLHEAIHTFEIYKYKMKLFTLLIHTLNRYKFKDEAAIL